MIEKFYRKILRHPRIIIIVFLLAAVICALLQTQVHVNYDIKDYLPEGTHSMESMDIMSEEFDGGIPNTRVMIEDVSISEALEYKEKLKNCEGITDITWLDDVSDVYKPLTFVDDEYVDTYYKNGNALFTVTIEDNKKIEATDEIREIIGDENSMSGQAVETAIATTSTVTEIGRIAAIAVIVVLIILLFATSSWIEPLIIFCCIGIAIVLNVGTNIIFGEISFVTNAAGNILQLALALDYTIFLMHRYEEYHNKFEDPKDAIILAVRKSGSSIISSGLAACFGFLALALMRFKLGSDLGLALGKSILISVITTFVLMPVLILLANKLFDKTRHKRLLPDFEGFAKFVYKIMIPCMLVLIILIIPSYMASRSNDYYYGSSHIFGNDTQIGKDREKIKQTYGKSDTYVLLIPQGDLATEKDLSDTLHRISQVNSIVSYVDTVGTEIPVEFVDDDISDMFFSGNYSRMIINVNADYEGDDTFTLVEDIRTIASEYYPDNYYLAGEGVSTYDLMDTITEDDIKVNTFAILAVSLVLLFVMRSISLPIILILCIETSIWMNLAISYFTDSVVFYITHLIICAVQLGATMDFAILLTDRYIEARITRNKKDAVIYGIRSTVPSIMVNGSALILVGFLLAFMTSHGILAQLGLLIGRGAVLSLLVVFTALPGFLYVFDGLIRRTTMGCRNFVIVDKNSEHTDRNIKIEDINSKPADR